MARGLLVWLLIMLAETAHGVLRGLLLVPRVGEERANLIGWPIGLMIVFAITLAAIRWTGISPARSLLGLGALWAALTVCFEMAIGLLRGMSAARIMAEINPASGLILYSAAVMLIAPWLAARLRGVR
jgi:hypothetical protein